MSPPPEMPTGFWSSDKIDRIFYYAKWFLKEHQAFIMIGTAVALAMALLTIIVNLFPQARDKDEDEYDYREI